MVWRNCSECGWSYNDRKGGCTNSACKNFDPTALGNPNPQIRTISNAPTLVKQPSADITPKASTGSILVGGSSGGITAPTTLPSSLLLNSMPSVDHVQSDPVVLPWIETKAATQSASSAPKGTELNAEPFTLLCYRGEKSEWWPEPRMRLACGGMHVFEPWPGKSIADIWKKLVEEVRKEAGFTVAQRVAAYAQYLRATGRPFALASARTTSGAFEGYSYVIEIKNARTFRWGKDYTLGPPVNFKDTNKTKYTRIVNQNEEIWEKDTIDADYIVLNADTIAASTILGFGHKTGTYEVTFLHDLPLSFVKSVNNQVPVPYTKEELENLPDSNHKQTALKLFRN